MSLRPEAHLFQIQYGLATLSQLAECGVTESSVRTRVRRGMYLREGRRVYGLAGMPVSYRRRVQLAVLEAGGLAVASHRTAAHLFAFDTFGPGPIELTVPTRRKAPDNGVVLHHTCILDRVDRSTVHGLPCTSAARTIIDLAGYCSTDELLNAIGSAQRDGLISLDLLHRRLSAVRNRGRRGVVHLDRVLSTFPDGGLHSVAEVAFLQICERIAAPTPVTATTAHRTADGQRHRRLVAEGLDVITFTTYEVFYEPEVVARDLRIALGRYFPQFAA